MLNFVLMVSLFIAVVGGGFKLMHWPGANLLLIVGLGSLGMCHFLQAFERTSTNPKTIYLNYARNFGMAVLLFGILFYLMRWKGDRIMLYMGVASVVLSFLFQTMSPGSEEEEK